MSTGSDGTPLASVTHNEHSRTLEVDPDYGLFINGRYPPSFDDTLADVGLFMLFLRFASINRFAESLLFVKQATLFSHMKRPRSEILEEATRIYWTYVAKGASAEVSSLKPEFRARLETSLWEPSGVERITSDLFAEGVAETRAALQPLHNKWLRSDEWKTCRFFRLPPPTIEVALKHPTLRTSLFEFAEMADANCGEQQNGGIGQRQRVLRFCRDVQILRQHCLDKKNQPNPPSEADLYQEYSSGVASIIFRNILILDTFVNDCNANENDVDYLDRAYRQIILILGKSNFYEEWLAKGSWRDVDYLPLMRKQTCDAQGIMQVPTLIAALSSPQMLHYLAYIVKPSQERSAALAFLLDIIKFMRTYKQTSPSNAISLSGDGTGNTASDNSGGGDDEKDSENSKKKSVDMAADAKKLYVKYLKDEKTGYAGVPHSLRSEIKAIVSSFNSRSKVNRDMFRRCGAYIYAYISRTWFRQIVGSYIWVDMEYDNNVPAASFVNEEFPLSLISDIPIIAPPSIDDIIHNNGVLKPFLNSLSGVVSSTVLAFIEATESFMNSADELSQLSECPKTDPDFGDEDQDNPATRKFREVMELLSPMILLFPQAKAFYRSAQSVLDEKRHKVFSKLLFQYPKNAILCDLLRKHYATWVSDESHWRSLSWAPRAVCCYDPNFGLFFFATYTSSKASDTDRAFFANNIAPKSIAVARHHHHYSTSTTVGTGSVSVPNTSTSSLSSSPSLSAYSTPGMTSPVSGDAPIISLHASGKSHSFQHTRNGVFNSSDQYAPPSPSSQFVTPGGKMTQNPSRLPSSRADGDKDLSSNNARRMARLSMRIETTHNTSPTSPVPNPGEGDPSLENLPMRFFGCPTLQQILESSFFRKMFMDSFLQETFSSTSEGAASIDLWKSLDSFFRKFNGLSDTELTKRRKEIVATALNVIDKNSQRITELYSEAGSPKTSETIKDILLSPNQVITPSFFRELEVLLCKIPFAIVKMQLWLQTNA